MAEILQNFVAFSECMNFITFYRLDRFLDLHWVGVENFYESYDKLLCSIFLWKSWVFLCDSCLILFNFFDILPNEWIMNQTDLHLEKSDLHNNHIETLWAMGMSSKFLFILYFWTFVWFFLTFFFFFKKPIEILKSHSGRR